MTNNDCIFCKIVAGEIPASKFWEDDDFIAIFDLFPNTKAQTVLISKKHLHSDIFNSDFKTVHKGLDAAKKTADLLTKAFKPSRIALVTEGVFVDHLHLKLFPIYNEKQFSGKLGEEKVFFDNFPGYVTTQGGPQWGREDLEGLVGEVSLAKNKDGDTKRRK